MVQSLIITGFGINCEVELAAAYQNAGAGTHIAHFNDIITGKVNLQEYDILNFPGGFSFGDDIASGKVMSNKIKFKKTAKGTTFIQEIETFLQNGNYILGICNGFQMLVQLGLLPNTHSNFEVETALEKNDSGKYEDRWVYTKINLQNNSPFLKNIDFLALPVRHGEGKLIIKDLYIQSKIIKNQHIAMQYCDAQANITKQYPQNPNGATLSIAALTDPTGQVLGMMPHPEAFLSFYNHPNWSTLQQNGQEIPRNQTGQVLFDNIVSFLEQRNEKS